MVNQETIGFSKIGCSARQSMNSAILTASVTAPTTVVSCISQTASPVLTGKAMNSAPAAKATLRKASLPRLSLHAHPC